MNPKQDTVAMHDPSDYSNDSWMTETEQRESQYYDQVQEIIQAMCDMHPDLRVRAKAYDELVLALNDEISDFKTTLGKLFKSPILDLILGQIDPMQLGEMIAKSVWTMEQLKDEIKKADDPSASGSLPQQLMQELKHIMARYPFPEGNGFVAFHEMLRKGSDKDAWFSESSMWRCAQREAYLLLVVGLHMCNVTLAEGGHFQSGVVQSNLFSAAVERLQPNNGTELVLEILTQLVTINYLMTKKVAYDRKVQLMREDVKNSLELAMSRRYWAVSERKADLF